MSNSTLPDLSEGARWKKTDLSCKLVIKIRCGLFTREQNLLSFLSPRSEWFLFVWNLIINYNRVDANGMLLVHHLHLHGWLHNRNFFLVGASESDYAVHVHSLVIFRRSISMICLQYSGVFSLGQELLGTWEFSFEHCQTVGRAQLFHGHLNIHN